MADQGINRLIINSPFTEPDQHWRYNRKNRTFQLVPERRPAGYLVASEASRSFDDPGVFIPIPLVNHIRPRVKAWREAGYPGVTAITRRLLEYWSDPEERGSYRLFFCQLEAIETLIWLAEAPDADKVGIEIPGDGGAFPRLCSKMATGTGKTVVMAMVIAWQILNKVTYQTDPRFSSRVFIVAPGLTVRSRLAVLVPDSAGNYYDEFGIIPPGLADKLRQGTVLVQNWHKLAWESEEQLEKRRSVDKRGPMSDEAYVRSVLGNIARHKNFIVINDEAHHAWRVGAGPKVKGIARDELDEATVWVSGLDRIHRARNIIGCYDFTATPFVPSGKKSTEEALFEWIISDFGLNDAIESGLVKTPRVVVRDDGKLTADYKSRFYHLYMDPEVKDDLNRRATQEEALPDLVTSAYYFLGKDWLETKRAWEESDYHIPPVLITVANRTETAARIKYTFDHGKIQIRELCDPARTLHIDSKVLKEAESRDEPVTIRTGSDDEDDDTPRQLTKKEQAELLRRQVDTVGRKDEPGEQIQNVISVGMLSEGWDAKTVTHIMGLRAFTSQLLCEQVVGRGLRRITFDLDLETGLFSPEYVNIFGVPFTFLPHESAADGVPRPEKHKTQIEPVAAKQEFEIQWPNVIRIEYQLRPFLKIDLAHTQRLVLEAASTPQIAELAAVVEGKPDVESIATIDLYSLGEGLRLQEIVFRTARNLFDEMKPEWKGDEAMLLGQLIRIVEEFVTSDRLVILPPFFSMDEVRRKVMLLMNMNKIVQHIVDQVRLDNAEHVEPVMDPVRPVRSTGDMGTWFTTKPCEWAKKSHINHCVFDSTWEATEAFALDRNPQVQAWVKNDHLGFDVFYVFRGVVKKYRPDFIIRLVNGECLILETKGREREEDRTKRKFLGEWVRAVNAYGSFGVWHSDVSYNPADVDGIVGKYYNLI